MVSLHDLIPPVRRARDCYLYTQDGRRILDLYRCGGLALLGYRPARIAAAEKRRLEQGLSAPLPTRDFANLERVLRALFPSHPHVTVARDYATALAAAAAAGFGQPLDPAFGGAVSPPLPGRARGAPPTRRACIWRPFLPLPAGCRLILPRLPYPAAWAPQPLCSADAAASVGGSVISAVSLAGAVVALAAARRAERERSEMISRGRRRSRSQQRRARPPRRPQRAYPELELEAAAKTETAAETEAGDTGGAEGIGVWLRRGPYLTTRLNCAAYAELFRRCLAAGILIAPDPGEPTILPQTMSPGEFQLFKKLSMMEPRSSE